MLSLMRYVRSSSAVTWKVVRVEPNMSPVSLPSTNVDMLHCQYGLHQL